MDRVAAAGSQESGHLRDDLPLVVVGLDRQHCLAHDEVRTAVGQAGVGGVGHDVLGVGLPGVGGQDARDLLAPLGIGVHALVGGGPGGQEDLSGPSDSGAQLDDAVGRRRPGGLQQAPGQADAARAQDSLAEHGQQPVALHAGGLGALTGPALLRGGG